MINKGKTWKKAKSNKSACIVSVVEITLESELSRTAITVTTWEDTRMKDFLIIRPDNRRSLELEADEFEQPISWTTINETVATGTLG